MAVDMCIFWSTMVVYQEADLHLIEQNSQNFLRSYDFSFKFEYQGIHLWVFERTMCRRSLLHHMCSDAQARAELRA